MKNISQIGNISTHTVIFAANTIKTIKDMTGLSFELDRSSLQVIPFLSAFNMAAYIHFTGTVQGDYILNLDEQTAARLTGLSCQGMPAREMRQMRKEYGGLIKELLNISVARAIPELEQRFGNLTYTPATLVYGELIFPEVMSGHITIQGTEEAIRCGFSINLARIKINRQLEQARQDLEKKSGEADDARKDLEQILEKIPSGVAAVNSDGRILAGHSIATAAVAGYTAGNSLSGLSLTEVLGLDADSSRHIREWIRLVFVNFLFFPFEKLRVLCDREYVNKHGNVLKLDWLPVVHHETFMLEKLQVIITDITEKLSLEQEKEEKERLKKQLRQAQKMEAIGTLAGGIAHDFNNIIQGILGYAEICSMGLPPTDRHRKMMENIILACYRARDIIRQLLTMSRQNEQERISIHIEPIVKEALKMLQSSLSKNIDIKQDIRTGSTSILADPTQIYQVIMNLCINASHAMKEKGGVLTLTLDEVEFNDDILTHNHGFKPGSYVELTIKDTGCGMASDLADHIFDPFFTTKPPGMGTGLGLAVVQGIIENHEGYINLYTEPDQGTTFKLFFPQTRQEPPPPETPGPAPTGHERILFVDDEKWITDSLGEILTGLGYQVTLESGGEAAMNTFRTDPDGYDLIITDSDMPKMSGIELAAGVLALRPDIPVILCTGFNKKDVKEKARNIGIRELVSKPYSKDDLARVIRKVLEKNEQSIL